MFGFFKAEGVKTVGSLIPMAFSELRGLENQFK